MRHNLLDGGIVIHFEAVLLVEANRSLIVLNDVQPHWPVQPEPLHSGAHQGAGNVTPVKLGIDHQPIELPIVRCVNRGYHISGETTVDMAKGPVQRIQPFPETIALLTKMGAKNNNRCRSC